MECDVVCEEIGPARSKKSEHMVESSSNISVSTYRPRVIVGVVIKDTVSISQI